MSTDDQQQDKLDALYHTGATTIYSAKTDPRFSYTLYVPNRLPQMDRAKTRILVSVHGTGRMIGLYRDMFAEFAEYNNCIVLAPLFPAGVMGDDNLSGYKFLKEGDIRYDQILLSMAREVADKYGVSDDRMLMFGFSGGGHFSHRFTLLHPERILAASVASPGVVTLADNSKDWWVGTGNATKYFGKDINLDALKDKPMHFVVGGADLETWEITLEEGDRSYMPGINDAGKNRPERSKSLCESFKAQGALTRFDIVDDVTHDVESIVHKVRLFFADVLNGDFTPDP